MPADVGYEVVLFTKIAYTNNIEKKNLSWGITATTKVMMMMMMMMMR